MRYLPALTAFAAFVIVIVLMATGALAGVDHHLFRRLTPLAPMRELAPLLAPLPASALMFALCLAAGRSLRERSVLLGAVAAAGLTEIGLRVTLTQPAGSLPMRVAGVDLVSSCPSGHELRGTLIVLLAANLIVRLHPAWMLRVAVTAAGAVLLVTLGWQLVASGAHYPSDVLGGFLLGVSAFLAARAFTATGRVQLALACGRSSAATRATSA